MAALGAIAEPIITKLKQLAAELLQEITPFVELIGKGLTGALSGAESAAESAQMCIRDRDRISPPKQ